MAAKFESEIKSSSCKKTHTSHILNSRKDAKIYAQEDIMCEYELSTYIPCKKCY